MFFKIVKEKLHKYIKKKEFITSSNILKVYLIIKILKKWKENYKLNKFVILIKLIYIIILGIHKFIIEQYKN